VEYYSCRNKVTNTLAKGVDVKQIITCRARVPATCYVRNAQDKLKEEIFMNTLGSPKLWGIFGGEVGTLTSEDFGVSSSSCCCNCGRWCNIIICGGFRACCCRDRIPPVPPQLIIPPSPPGPGAAEQLDLTTLSW